VDTAAISGPSLTTTGRMYICYIASGDGGGGADGHDGHKASWDICGGCAVRGMRQSCCGVAASPCPPPLSPHPRPFCLLLLLLRVCQDDAAEAPFPWLVYTNCSAQMMKHLPEEGGYQGITTGCKPWPMRLRQLMARACATAGISLQQTSSNQHTCPLPTPPSPHTPHGHPPPHPKCMFHVQLMTVASSSGQQTHRLE